ncbi:MAG: energy transducer TonB [Bacteroidales bacterium]|jgi:hypothetical protein|nr:energy transducer TonB [Bacteroidales bacterium]
MRRHRRKRRKRKVLILSMIFLLIAFTGKTWFNKGEFHDTDLSKVPYIIENSDSIYFPRPYECIKNNTKILEKLVFLKVDEMPKFLGHTDDSAIMYFREYIKEKSGNKNLKRDSSIVVFVKIIVDSDGNLNYAKILRLKEGSNPERYTIHAREDTKEIDKWRVKELLDEIIRSPRWIPGEQNGEKVAVTYIFPMRIHQP